MNCMLNVLSLATSWIHTFISVWTCRRLPNSSLISYS